MGMLKKVVILGGAGDGVVAAEVIKSMNSAGQSLEFIGFLNDSLAKKELISGYPVLGKTDEWDQLSEDIQFHCCLLSVGKMKSRSELIADFKIPEKRLISLIHPQAVVAENAKIGHGVMLAANVICQPGVQIGAYSSVRGGANLGHDVSVGEYAYVGPNATLCGYASTGKGSYVAPNAVLRDKAKMGDYSVLSAGSVALKDIPAETTWMGNPAKRVL